MRALASVVGKTHEEWRHVGVLGVGLECDRVASEILEVALVTGRLLCGGRRLL
jgi:hypothetical protein